MLTWLAHCGRTWCHNTELCHAKDSVLVPGHQSALSSLQQAEKGLKDSCGGTQAEVQMRIRQKMMEFFEVYGLGVVLTKIGKSGNTVPRTILIDTQVCLCVSSAKGTKRFSLDDIAFVRLGLDMREPVVSYAEPEELDVSRCAYLEFDSRRCTRKGLRLSFESNLQRNDFVFCLQALVLHRQQSRPAKVPDSREAPGLHESEPSESVQLDPHAGQLNC